MDFGAPVHHVSVIDFRPFPLRFYEVAHIPLSSLVSSVTNHALTIHLPFGHSTSLSPRASLSTALPLPSAALTIFYILYHLPLSSLHILPFSTLWFRTVQNVDASLQSVPLLSLLCSSLLCSLVRFSAPGVLLVWFLCLFFSSPFYSFTCHSLCFITHSTLIQTMLFTSSSWPLTPNQNTP